MTNTTIETRYFKFSCITAQEHLDEAFNIGDLELVLNGEINIMDYTDKLVTIGFIPIILEEKKSTIHEETSYYDAKEKEILIQKRVTPDEDMKLFFIRELETFLEELPELENLINKIKEVLLYRIAID